MTYDSPAYIEADAQKLYYLGADLILIRAPIRGDVTFSAEGVELRGVESDDHLAARDDLIRAALLCHLSRPRDGTWLARAVGVLDAASERMTSLRLDQASLLDGIFLTVQVDTEIRLPIDPA